MQALWVDGLDWGLAQSHNQPRSWTTSRRILPLCFFSRLLVSTKTTLELSCNLSDLSSGSGSAIKTQHYKVSASFHCQIHKHVIFPQDTIVVWKGGLWYISCILTFSWHKKRFFNFQKREESTLRISLCCQRPNVSKNMWTECVKPGARCAFIIVLYNCCLSDCSNMILAVT